MPCLDFKEIVHPEAGLCAFNPIQFEHINSEHFKNAEYDTNEN